MKKSILVILTSAFVPITSFAQFNTIGDVTSRPSTKTIKKTSEQTVAPKDSILPSNTASAEIPNGMENKEEKRRIYLGGSLPLKKIKIKSMFGMRMHPVYHKYIMHNGIDLHARYENVYSMFPGTVVKVGQDNKSGKYVTVRTGDYTISYCHLSQPFVKENDFVTAGKTIAVSGNTGASTGPHLHITAKKNGKVFNVYILLKYIMQSTI